MLKTGGRVVALQDAMSFNLSISRQGSNGDDSCSEIGKFGLLMM
ncbi:hypothetical protein ECWI1_1705 [Escherichia coli]|nr:hypothetical protein EC180050_2323 [Escherichia coli 180050]ESL37564.1 hypothetical protein L474_02183 [Escherichia coli BIDMC 37]MDD1408735.1 hypothetical protein [Escherichia coli]SMB26420.1 hypothetical protein ECWI2_1711 [Escherichia coli]SMB26421.1 hypothetical protein ECWI1_1705 [Escherichia coli]